MATKSSRQKSSLIGLERPFFGQLARELSGLKSQQIEAALELQRKQGGRLGDILCEQGLLTREQVIRILHEQARRVAKARRGDLKPNAFPYPGFMSLCLPAYNEEANIRNTLDAACASLPEFIERFEVLVVDDGSHDETGRIVKRYVEMDSRVRLIRHSQNQGYGGAVSSGLQAAEGNLIAFTDADGQFSFADLPQLLTELDDSDVVMGYRYRRSDNPVRCFNAWAWNRLIRAFLGIQVRDLDCAFKLFRREVIKRLQFTTRGAAINAEILVQCTRMGCRIREIPVSHYPRYHGAPTGAALWVILRAFRELPHLWKYRYLGPLESK